MASYQKFKEQVEHISSLPTIDQTHIYVMFGGGNPWANYLPMVGHRFAKTKVMVGEDKAFHEAMVNLSAKDDRFAMPAKIHSSLKELEFELGETPIFWSLSNADPKDIGSIELLVVKGNREKDILVYYDRVTSQFIQKRLINGTFIETVHEMDYDPKWLRVEIACAMVGITAQFESIDPNNKSIVHQIANKIGNFQKFVEVCVRADDTAISDNEPLLEKMYARYGHKHSLDIMGIMPDGKIIMLNQASLWFTGNNRFFPFGNIVPFTGLSAATIFKQLAESKTVDEATKLSAKSALRCIQWGYKVLSPDSPDDSYWMLLFERLPFKGEGKFWQE